MRIIDPSPSPADPWSGNMQNEKLTQRLGGSVLTEKSDEQIERDSSLKNILNHSS